MKKFFSNLKAIIGCTVVTAMLASSVVSCSYDDTELRGEIDNVKKELAELRTDLQSQIDQLKGLVDGLLTVKSIVTNEDGTTTVTLSDDSVFTIQPEASLEGVITIVEQEGVKYWAQYNAEGETVLISVNGANCPVIGAEPQTRVNEETNSIEVSFDGGFTWVATGSYTGVVKAEIIYSEWQFDEDGNPLALYAQFTMADGTVVKTRVEGQAIMMWTDTAYTTFGSTTTLPLSANIGDYAEYMFQLPAGWSAEVVEIEWTKEEGIVGEVEIYFTAPSAEAVASGAAAADGEAKMLVQFRNGDMAIAKMRVTTKVVDIEVTGDGMAFTNNGWDVYAYGTIFYGITNKADFDKAAIVEAICDPYDMGYSVILGNVSFRDSNVCEYDWSVYPEELVPGESYVVWVVPALMDMNTYAYITSEADITYAVYNYYEVSFEVVTQHLFDVEANFSIAGSDKYNGFVTQIMTKDNYDPKALADEMNYNTYYWQYGYTKADGEYTGKLTGWAAYGPDDLYPATDYVFCVIPGNESLVFTPNDIYAWEFSTKGVEATGGTITLDVNEEDSYNDYAYIQVVLEASVDAAVAYYKFVPKHEASAYSTDELIVEYLLDPENDAIIATKAGAVIYCSAGSWNLEGEPGDEFTLFAVAAEADGKLGKPLSYNCSYKAVEYNDLVVDVTVSDLNYEKVVIDVACEGASKFLYRVVDAASNIWKQDCKGSAEGASKFFALNSESPYYIYHSDNNTAASYYAHRFENGQIIFTGGAAGVAYVVCVAAMDENQNISKVTAVEFTPTMNMGTIRYKTDAEWESSKPVVAMYDAEVIGDFYSFDWYVTPVEGYTAYTVAEHKENYAEYGVDTTDVKQMIQFICSHSDVVECEYNADGYTVDKGHLDDNWEWIENLVDAPGIIASMPYGAEGMNEIWTTWCDAEGNYFEPFKIDAKM